MTTPIIFGPQTLGSVAADGGAEHEWLVTDGLGGFAAGTAPGLRTRRCHALLTVAEPQTAVRRVGLAALDLTLTLPSGAHVPLHTHEWQSGAVAPQGHRHLESFSLADGLPRWRWRVGDIVIERELAMAHGSSSLGVVHRVVSAPEPVGLAVAAMCTWRDAHGERYAGGPPLRTTHLGDGVLVEDAYRLAGPGWQPAGGWHLGAYLREEAATEDLWLAGTFVDRVAPGGISEISAWAGSPQQRPPAASVVIAAARERAHALITAAKADGYAATLVLAADRFIVRAADGPDVVAGYPWSGSHLGDTMAGYEGLFLETGRADEGRELLLARTRAARSPSPSGPQGSLDAPLWLVHAVDRHVARTGDSDLAAELAAPLSRLLRGHLGGRGALAVDPGDELVRLDGTARGGTPRIGKPVEINALWVNALAALGDLHEEAGRDAGPFRQRHARARQSFAARYRAPEGWLYDVIDGPASAYPLGAGAFDDDPSLRPHQLLAWSLPHAPLAGSPDRDADRAAVRAVGAALLTPLGLRTLAPTEYGYQGAHRGGHDQGTVWPWLIGPYADACAATGLSTEGLLTGLEAHLRDWGAGSVSETADGDPPHRASGCPFSARGVAEALRTRGYAQ